MSKNKISYLLPVMSNSKDFIDISGYKECFKTSYKDKNGFPYDIFYVRMRDNSVVVVGDSADNYSDWSEVENKVISPGIDQNMAKAVIHDKFPNVSLNDINLIRKEINGVFLTENGRVFDCAGYVIYPEENYENNIDIFEYNNYGGYYIFALKASGEVCLVSKSGSSAYDNRVEKIVDELQGLKGIVKIVSDSHLIVALDSKGKVYKSEGSYYDFMMRSVDDWKNIKDIVIQYSCVYAEDAKGNLYYQLSEYVKEPMWDNFKDAVKGSNYIKPLDENISFADYDYVNSFEKYIYGFRRNGQIQICSLDLYYLNLEVNVRLKRMMVDKRHSKSKVPFIYFYFVDEQGKSYYLDYKHELQELEAITNLKMVMRKGYLTDQGDFFERKNDVGEFSYNKTPVKKNILEAYDCAKYYAFFYQNNYLEIIPAQKRMFKITEAHNVKKVCFTDEHVVILYNDGSLGYSGENTAKRYKKMDKITDAINIEISETKILVYTESDKEIFF